MNADPPDTSGPHDTQAQPPPAAPQEPEPEKESAESRTRNGFVARLTKDLRDQINHMLLDGVPFRKIIENLGDPGKHLNEGHITTWKAGGYKEWLADLERKEALCATRDSALDVVAQKAGITVQDAGRSIAAAHLYELITSFNPKQLADALADKPELYLRIVNALSRLSEGEVACGRRRARNTVLETTLHPDQPDRPKAIAPDTLKEIVHLIKLL